MKRKLFMVILLLNSCLLSSAQDSTRSCLLPDHVKLQFAGNIGVFSAGFGYSFKSERIQSDLMYGYVPPNLGGSPIHTLAFKNTFRFYKHALNKHIDLSLAAGLSLNYSITHFTFVRLPEIYPDGYYSANAIHVAPLISADFQYKTSGSKILNKAGLYFELGTLDSYLWFYVKSRHMDFADIWNFAIGIKKAF